MVTVEDVISRLESRASNHGVDVDVLLEKIPSNVVDSHTEVNEWLDIKDVSHIKPQSTHPHLADEASNIIWEDSDVNRSRGAQEMTDVEVLTAQLDNEFDARIIDNPTVDVPEMDWLDVLVSNDIDISLDTIDVGFPETSPILW
jgi:hypothetical protein